MQFFFFFFFDNLDPNLQKELNKGERGELLTKITLTLMRDNNIPLGKNIINSVGFLGKEYGSLKSSPDIYKLSTDSTYVVELAHSIGIEKSPKNAKADVMINKIGYSLKLTGNSSPSILNHTKRPGIERVCKELRIDIGELDSIIEEYWEKREKGLIRQDTRNKDDECPFSKHKEYLRPIIEYFMFDGTGDRKSVVKADYILDYHNPWDYKSYVVLDRNSAFEKYWPSLIFSMREKNLPVGYTLDDYSRKDAESIAKWVRFCDGKYKGSLHIRIKE